MINVLNLDNEIVMQLTEADITKLLRVLRAVTALEFPIYELIQGSKYEDDVNELIEALKEAEHLL